MKYPHTVSRFRCPVCDTINDLKPHIRQQLSNQPLTLKILKRAVNECKIKERATKTTTLDEKDREKFYEPVEKLIETIFSSWVCLNHSFLNVSQHSKTYTTSLLTTTTQGNETSLENSGINMEDTRDAYRIILNLVIVVF